MSQRNLTRRDFLKVSFTASGSLLISSYLAACAPNTPTPAPTVLAAPTEIPTTFPTATALPTATTAPTTAPVPQEPFEPNLFIRIDPDGTVTLTIHRSEMGQGPRTALAMILADELEADWTKVRVEQSDANPKIGNNQITGGSGTIADTFLPLRNAGARGRAILIAAAAQTWGVKPEECRAEKGNVIHTATDRRLDYGSLVGAARTVKLSGIPALKDSTEFRLIGTSVPRVDEPVIVTGKAIYGLDVRVPGMLFATVARPPVPAGSVAKYDATRAEKVPGVRKVVQVNSGVAVVAENTWAAIQGRAALDVTWNDGPNAALDSASIRKQMVDLIDKERAQAIAQATANDAAGNFTTIEATYETPYLAHAPMEPVNCVAHVRADRCEIWAPTQNPQEVQSFVREAINLPTDVHVTLIGGGFGRRLEVDYAIESARVSKAVGAPVQVVWTREDDIQHDYYRQPTYHRLRAGWDKDGKLALWRHFMAGPGLNGLAYREGADVLEEGLGISYSVPDRFSRPFLANIPLPTGPWRAVMAGPNAFANECFFDEVAAALDQDPYEFRMALLPQTDRKRGVLELAASKANWKTPIEKGHGRGIACHTYHDTSVAMVADVSVTNGAVRVHKIVCAVDCGLVIHPDMVAQQMEGAVAYGLSSLLKGEITFKQGRVEQSNFNDYPILQTSEMPEVEVHLVPSTSAPRGVGEMGVPPLVPAVVNAIFAVTGKRIRHTPIHAEDLRA